MAERESKRPILSVRETVKEQHAATEVEDKMDKTLETTETEKNARIPRDNDTRELNSRPQQWAPPSILPEPDKQPGYSYRWVRISSGKDSSRSDPLNMSSKFREGWEPVRKEEQPHLALLADEKSRFDDNIEIAGLLLCKIPDEIVRQRKEYYSNMNKAQLESVDNNFMRENDARMPLFAEKRTKVSFGSGR